MKLYACYSKVTAEPMTRGAYNTLRGWTIPADENPDDDGYVVVRSDNSIAWIPKALFENDYKEI